MQNNNIKNADKPTEDFILKEREKAEKEAMKRLREEEAKTILEKFKTKKNVGK